MPGYKRHGDLAGRRFGRLLVLPDKYPPEASGKCVRYECVCDCGTKKIIPRDRLVAGHAISCGCALQNRKVIHGAAKHGMMAPEYRSWRGMRNRCNQPNDKGYYLYGARGIKVCERWQTSFVAFFADMGPRPSPHHSLDRINSNGHYEPSNCRWATRKEQQHNRRDNILLTHGGRTLPISVWAKEIGISTATLKYRMNVKRLSLAQSIAIKKHSRSRNADRADGAP